MKLPVKELAGEALDCAMPQTWHSISPEDLDRIMEKFAELVVRACADHVLESSDRYRKEYFANKILELIDES